MRCRTIRDLISRSLDETLDEYERSRLAEHLTDCTDCRRHESVLVRGRELMKAGAVAPSENFEWKVQLGIQRALRQRAADEAAATSSGGAFWRPLLLSASGVALVVILAGSLWLLPAGRGVVEGLPAGEGSGAGNAIGPLAEGAAEPDLSGAVRRPDFEIDLTDGRFGIRTVGGAASLERGGWHPSSTPTQSPWGWQPSPSGDATAVSPQLRGLWVPIDSIHRLQLLRRQSRLPAATTDPNDSTPPAASPR